MQDLQQCITDERDALAEKIGKLHTFTDSDIFRALPTLEQGRLERQLQIMRDYRAVLNERIAAQQAEAEHIAAQRLEAERVKAVQLEAERVREERFEAEKLEAEPEESQTTDNGDHETAVIEPSADEVKP